jgi:S1-C subfamily serine protease
MRAVNWNPVWHRLAGWAGVTLLSLCLTRADEEPAVALADTEAVAAAPTADIRRDATVLAVERVMPAVVNIATRSWVDRESAYERRLREFYGYQRRPQANYARGSGVVIDEDGYVLTNSHVVGDAADIWVQFYDSDEAIPAERVELSQSKDVALLRLKPKQPRKFRALKFAQDDDLLLGETVIALGNPFGLGGSIAKGILSSKSRRPADALPAGESLDIADWLQTDAAINPGNSGGPLVNLRGELIGLNVAVLNPGHSQGIGFAIPIRRVNEALAEMLSGESVNGYWFGARLKPASRPLTVQVVQPGSPAAQAGLQAGDTLLEVDGKPPGSLIEFNRVLTTAKDKREIRLRLRRQGGNLDAQLRLIDERVFFNNALLRKRAGFTVRETPNGFAVETVERGGPAEAAKLRPGMLLTAADEQPVDSLVSLAKAAFSHADEAPLRLGVLFLERAGYFVRRYEGEVAVRLR